MSGHSKWSTIKHKKGVKDARRGKLFSQLSRDISVAVREGGGGDPEMNFMLRMAVDKAKEASMPKDNIEKAINRGLGKLEGGDAVEIIRYEAFANDGVPMVIQVSTDNKNRTVSEMRKILEKAGGSIGGSGSVMWQFKERGQIILDGSGESQMIQIMEIKGASDVDTGIFDEKEATFVFCEPKLLHQVVQELKEQGLDVLKASQELLPTTPMELSKEAKDRLHDLLDELEDRDDVEKVWVGVK